MSTASGVAALAVGGFTLSFTALRELAEREFAIAPQLSFIYPLVIDGFIVIATAAAFTMKNRGPRVTWYPWAALGVFGVLSVLGNAAHAMDNPTATFPSWVSALGASVPAVALLIASHLLVMMIDGRGQRRTRRRSAAAPAGKQDRSTVTAPSPAPTEVGAPARLHAVEQHGEDRPLVAAIESAVAGGRRLDASLIMELEGVSARTSRRRLAKLREERPDLFDDRQEVAQ